MVNIIYEPPVDGKWCGKGCILFKQVIGESFEDCYDYCLIEVDTMIPSFNEETQDIGYKRCEDCIAEFGVKEDK